MPINLYEATDTSQYLNKVNILIKKQYNFENTDSCSETIVEVDKI